MKLVKNVVIKDYRFRLIVNARKTGTVYAVSAESEDAARLRLPPEPNGEYELDPTAKGGGESDTQRD